MGRDIEVGRLRSECGGPHHYAATRWVGRVGEGTRVKSGGIGVLKFAISRVKSSRCGEFGEIYGVNLEIGGANLEKGSVNLEKGGVNLEKGGVNLEIGGVNSEIDGLYGEIGGGYGEIGGVYGEIGRVNGGIDGGCGGGGGGVGGALGRGLAGVVGGAGFADDADADLAGVAEGAFDLAGDVLGEDGGLLVGDARVLDEDADLAAHLDRVGALDALVGGAQLLEVLEAGDVGLELLAAGAGAGLADLVAGVDDVVEDGAGLLIALAGGDF